MIEKEVHNIQCIEKGQEKDAVEIKLFLEDLVLEKEGDNYFESLIEPRKELEKNYK